jgi:hypothetical protein
MGQWRNREDRPARSISSCASVSVAVILDRKCPNTGLKAAKSRGFESREISELSAVEGLRAAHQSMVSVKTERNR